MSTEIGQRSALVEPGSELTEQNDCGLLYADMRCRRDAENCLDDRRRYETLVTITDTTPCHSTSTINFSQFIQYRAFTTECRLIAGMLRTVSTIRGVMKPS